MCMGTCKYQSPWNLEIKIQEQLTDRKLELWDFHKPSAKDEFTNFIGTKSTRKHTRAVIKWDSSVNC